MQSARLAGALVQMPQGYVFVWLLQHTDGSWRLADAGERREGRSEGWVMQLLLLDAGPLWQQTSLSEPARQPVISKMVGATNPRVA